MASIEKLIRQKQDALEEIPAQFISRVQGVQKQILSEILSELNKLELDSSGSIKLTAKNVKILDQINIKMKDVLRGDEYLSAVKELTGGIATQGKITRKIIEQSFETTDFNSINEILLKQSRQAIAGELVGSAVEVSALKPVQSVLQSAVSSNASLKDTVANLTDVIIGNKDKVGALERYSGTIAYDSFANADRAYTTLLGNETGAEWFLYAGGAIKSTRAFCSDRAGQYFHRKEIEAWGDGRVTIGITRPTETSAQWQGKNPNTNSATIFVYAGGYNCQHIIIPVPPSQVPIYVIERNIKNGNIHKDYIVD